MPIGEDRFRRRYWVFSHAAADEDRLFVECDTSLSTCRVVPLLTTSTSSSSSSQSASSAIALASSSSSPCYWQGDGQSLIPTYL